ncbi:Solute carrier family 46 member 3 [Halotydeus destructor]|nr:Solute carrier family 46 member 3 [Halotydeus destructor]
MAESSSLFELFRILKVEPFLFFVFLAFLAKQNTFTQFYQDKICLVTYNRTAEECAFIPSTELDEYRDLKTNILKGANELVSYQAVMRTVPGIIFTILLAPWADKVIGARRKLMIFSSLGQIADSIFGIVSVVYEDTLPPWTALAIGIPSALAGAMLAINISTNGYVSMTTPLVHMSLRFIIMDIISSSVRPLATLLAGMLLGTPSWLPGKVRNFTALYCVTLVSGVLALLWTLIFIDNSDCKEDDSDNEKEKYKFFNMENLRKLQYTFMLKRENLGRVQLWLLITINGLAVFAFVGAGAVMLSYVQKVYHWNIEKFSKISAALAGCTFVAFALGSPVLTNVFKFTDPQLGLFGLTSGGIGIVLLGTIPEEVGFYLFSLISTYGAVGSSAVRSSVSKLVGSSEKSSAFALIAIFQNVFTLLGTWYYQIVFNATITTMPGLCFLTASTFLLVAMGCFIWIDFHNMKTLKSGKVEFNKEKEEAVLTKL